ncbi:uncharacterized protein N7483_005065 [Penicillium malachiteum]|uniref:uncharacterized protein n=1 Tax=Penicillium malachiteum TaxID=1324776 RepID=UPI0025468F1B|nr:uncharacterized protein N7483_005065 [Penicillium malachiteum]KAJ5730557.1 hypothetical protein N7483_005065 [Penicillium malachiteum]
MGDRQVLRAWTEYLFGGESSTSEGYGIIIITAEGESAKPRQNDKNDKDETTELQGLRRSNQVQQEKRNSTREIVKQVSS